VIPISDDNPTERAPVVNWLLIVACVLVFVWEFSLGAVDMDSAMGVWGFTPAAFFGHMQAPSEMFGVPAAGTIVTSMFFHGSVLHLLGNMLYLWIFGDNIEEAMGHVRYVLFYLACGAAAALTMSLLDPSSDIPMVGASGAISGVLGAYMLLYPRARVRELIPLGIIPVLFWIRAVWVVGIWFVLQLVSAAYSEIGEPGTAFWAHVGGFIAGLLLTPVLKSRHVRYFGPYFERY